MSDPDNKVLMIPPEDDPWWYAEDQDEEWIDQQLNYEEDDRAESQ